MASEELEAKRHPSVLARYRRFAHEYVKHGHNGAKAYQTVYDVAPNVASVEANRLLNDPMVQAMVQAKELEIANYLELDTDRIVSEVAKLAFGKKRDAIKLGALQLASKIKGLEKQSEAPTGLVVFQIVGKPEPLLDITSSHGQEDNE